MVEEKLCTHPIGLMVRDFTVKPEVASQLVDLALLNAKLIEIPPWLILAFGAHESHFRQYCYSDKFYYEQIILKHPTDTTGWPARKKVTFGDWGHKAPMLGTPKVTDNVWGSYGVFQTLYETAVRNGFSREADPFLLFDLNTNVDFFGREITKAKKRGAKTPEDIAAIYNSGKSFARAPLITRERYVPSVMRYAAMFRGTGSSYLPNV